MSSTMFSFAPLMTPLAPSHKFLGAQSEVNRIKECRGHAPAGVTLEQAGRTSRRRSLVVIVERGLVTGTGTQVSKGPGYLVAFPSNHPQRKYYSQFDRKVPALIFFAEGNRGGVFCLTEKSRSFEEVP